MVSPRKELTQNTILSSFKETQKLADVSSLHTSIGYEAKASTTLPTSHAALKMSRVLGTMVAKSWLNIT